MELKIGTRKLDLYNNVSVALHYDSVASAFSFDFYFDPNNADHKAMFLPGSYSPVTIDHNGERLITGILLSPKFKSDSVRRGVTISGYSKTGVLEDCEIPTSSYPLQAIGLSLGNIAQRIIKPFGLNLVIDPSVSSNVNSVYKSTTADDKQTVKSYLCELAGQKHVMLSHDEMGNLLLTQAKITQQPIFDFTNGMPNVAMELNFDGQRMHSSITLQKQATKTGKGNAGQSSFSNPYVTSTFRPHVTRQTSGTDVDTALCARNMLSEELKGLTLTIDLDRWTLNNKVIRPNNIITVTNPDLYIYKKTKFFITSVELKGDNNAQVATLTCTLPEVYSSTTPKNIFL